jgi:hypothetical protein
MRNGLIFTVAVFVALSVTSPHGVAAQGQPLWTPEPCLPSERAGDSAAIRRLRDASPRSPAWVPELFPREPAQVRRNLAHHLERIWGGKADTNPGELQVLDALRDPRSVIEIRAVANWEPTRCRSVLKREVNDRYWHVRVFDPDTGKEVGRATLRGSGAFSVLQVAETGWFFPEWPDRERARLAVESVLGRSVEDGQYVISHGSVRCTHPRPCLAFRAGQSLFVCRGTEDGGCELFRGDLSASERIPGEMRDVRRYGGLLPIVQRLRLEGRELLAVGRSFLVMERVTPQ